MKLPVLAGMSTDSRTELPFFFAVAKTSTAVAATLSSGSHTTAVAAKLLQPRFLNLEGELLSYYD